MAKGTSNTKRWVKNLEGGPPKLSWGRLSVDLRQTCCELANKTLGSPFATCCARLGTSASNHFRQARRCDRSVGGTPQKCRQVAVFARGLDSCWVSWTSMTSRTGQDEAGRPVKAFGQVASGCYPKGRWSFKNMSGFGGWLRYPSRITLKPWLKSLFAGFYRGNHHSSLSSVVV